MDWDRHKADWPNAKHSHFVTAKPHRWHVQSKGVGQTILLLHGAGASTHTWGPIFSALGQQAHVVAVDLPGQGFTKLGARSRCGLPDMVADIRALLQSLEITPEVIVGHSAGAAIALTLAAEMTPQPTVISINGALENFRGIAGVLFPAFAKALALNPATGHIFSLVNGNAAGVRRLIESTGSHITDAQLAYYLTLVKDSGHVNATLAMMAQWSLDDLPDTLERLKAPGHFLVGGKDNAVPPDASKRAARHIANATFDEMADLGHLMHEEASDRVMSWLVQHVKSLAPTP